MLTNAQLEQARRIFERPSTFGTVATGACLQIIGEEFLEWDPAILDQELSGLVGAEHVHDNVIQRMHAVTTVLLSLDFFTKPVVFHAVCATLLDPDTDPSVMNAPPSPVEMAWSCAEVQLLLGTDYSSRNFSPQVSRYCGVSLENAGLHFPPATLRFADFPGEQYPDTTKYSDETLLMAWTDTQQQQVGTIDAAVVELTKLMGRQLLELKVFGGIQEQFERLAEVFSEEVRGTSSL